MRNNRSLLLVALHAPTTPQVEAQQRMSARCVVLHALDDRAFWDWMGRVVVHEAETHRGCPFAPDEFWVECFRSCLTPEEAAEKSNQFWAQVEM